MQTLSIDIETTSSIDLNKTGVYRYAKSPDFTILLFGYSIDHKPVQVVDLASGERLPAEVLAALFDPSVPDTLSQLVRTAFIPSEAHRFIVADFSAIEARVIAWLAGEQWRLNLFRAGGDIYCQSASQMFGVPVEKHGANAELRQKGKISELACGYGESVGALTAMGHSTWDSPRQNSNHSSTRGVTQTRTSSASGTTSKKQPSLRSAPEHQ